MVHNLDLGELLTPSASAEGWLLLVVAVVLGAAVSSLFRVGWRFVVTYLRRAQEPYDDELELGLPLLESPPATEGVVPATSFFDRGDDAMAWLDDVPPAAVGTLGADDPFESTTPSTTPGTSPLSTGAGPAGAVAAVPLEVLPEPVAPLRATVPAVPDVVPVARDREVGLARTTLTLLVRQLAVLDELLDEESDPQALADLVRVQQLAHQVQRTCTSVLVVAGEDEAAKLRMRPMPTSDLLLEAVAGIEQSHRVSMSVMVDPVIPSHLGSPLLHLLTELIDNATRFSEPQTTVAVLVSHTEEGLRLRVTDDGAGIGPQKLAELNQLIADPPQPAQVGPARGLGLIAVGRLARRIGADVLLASSIGRGTVASIDLPLALEPGTDATTGEAPAFPVVEAPTVRAAARVDDARVDDARVDDAPLDDVPVHVEPVVAQPVVAQSVVAQPVVAQPIAPVPVAPVPVAPAGRAGVTWLSSIGAEPVHGQAVTPGGVDLAVEEELVEDEFVEEYVAVPVGVPEQRSAAQHEVDELDQVEAQQPDLGEGYPRYRPQAFGAEYPTAVGYSDVAFGGESGTRPPAPWDLDDEPSVSSPLAMEILPRKKGLLPKNRKSD